jgi:dTMP kinase
MQQQGIDPLAVREPGGTPVAEALRRELLADEREWSAGAELLYMVTARADLVARVIRPALQAGRVVLSDRFDLSTMAYQGAGRGLPMDQVRWVNHATGAARRRLAGKGEDRLEREDSAFHDRVSAAYLAATGPGVHHLQGGASPQAVLHAAWQVLVATRPDIFRPAPVQGA